MPATLDLVRLHPSITSSPATIAPRHRRAPRRALTGSRSLRVHPEVWQTALRLAGGDALRIDVETAERVVVRVRNRD